MSEMTYPKFTLRYGFSVPQEDDEMEEAKKYCFVLNASKNTKIHHTKTGSVEWSDGEIREQCLPACGTRVDVCSLETAWGTSPRGAGLGGPLCLKCFPD